MKERVQLAEKIKQKALAEVEKAKDDYFNIMLNKVDNLNQTNFKNFKKGAKKTYNTNTKHIKNNTI